MPPRHAYWTILIGDLPTAFRAREREELLPTFERLRAKQPDAVLKWFERGRLWASPQEARGPAPSPAGRPERRGKEWRPGGAHRDPRDRFKKPKTPGDRGRDDRRAQGPPTDRPRDDRPRDERPREERGKDAPRRPWQPRADPRAARPKPDQARGDKPWQAKPPGGRPADRGWRPKPPSDRGDKPWRPKPPGGQTDRPWRPKPPGDRADKPWRPKPDGGPDRPKRDREDQGPQRDRSPREERGRKGGTRLVKKVRR